MLRRRAKITDALRQRVLSGLHLGLLHPGDRLPSIRTIAAEFGVDPRVGLAAYRELAIEGVVELRPRSGIYVAVPSDHGPEQRTSRQSDWLADILVQGLQRGIAATELPNHLARCLTALRLRAVVVECTRDQLWSMTDELIRDYGIDASPVDLATLRPHRARADLPAAMRAADLLVSTAYHAAEVHELARTLGIPAIVVTMCTDLFAETGRLLARGQVYFVVDDPRMERKLHEVFASADGAQNLRTLVRERDDLEAIPPKAPVYLTRLTRERLPSGNPLLARTLPEARVFTAASAREITAYLVRTNLAALMVQAVGRHTADPATASPGSRAGVSRA